MFLQTQVVFGAAFDAARLEAVRPIADELIVADSGSADGTTDIIYKPFDLNTLFEKVEGLIGSASDLIEKDKK